MLKPYVTYFIAQPHKVVHRMGSGNVRSLFPVSDSDRIAETLRQAVNEYIDSLGNADVLETHIEIPENRKTNKWPQLERAIEVCKLRNATLVIAELGTLTNNETFSQLLLESGVQFYCCDQPFVNSTILEALHKHAQLQRKVHGELIRAGLKMTSAKSGNPNAAEVISKVNKPKIDVAIVFADLLQPIIADYKRKGYSQRQMVKTLNEEGFTAPEGGKWVLSQLQKVLDRVRLNEVSRDVRTLTEKLRAEKLSEAQIADELNAKGISSIKRSTWDETQVKKLIARLDQIKDIELINKFVLDLLPLLHEYRKRGLSAFDVIAEFDKAGLTIRQEQAEAVAFKEERKMSDLSDSEIKVLLQNLQSDLETFPEGMNSLEYELESAAKHVPAYIKVVKGHIEQLRKVLELENHNHRTLESAGLAAPVQQLIKLFNTLQDEDIQMLEDLAMTARNWQSDMAEDEALESTNKASSMFESAETAS